ncbi:LL-diaminopimelate aminotransferase [Bacillus thermotolerans]|uniref:LL-diaminopimelate aminotransferase n=1 Tax=Bacillus thermotolerans TaxID=1221996 RepID=UPI0005828223|nr:LL-diaminopimelate aminotransferase [Bacillus thermotolerans]KKB33074.1 Aspartate aminotransferase [Bacillus thermotolerans]KKB37342.1 Aspartate aminotransferase [Bacillus thermotolerans]
MAFRYSKRMENFGPSIFSELKAFKQQKEAEGKELIDLSLGSPDLPPAEIVRKELANSTLKEDQYGYTLSGTSAFYEAIARYYKRVYGVSLDPATEIVHAMGSQEGLVHLPLVFADPGDVILVPNPGYTAYETGLAVAGAKPHYMPLLKENHFLPDLAAIPETVARQAKLMILNYPGNPVAGEANEAFFKSVIAFAKEYEVAVLHDAAYSEFYFDDGEPLSFLAVEGASEVGIEINSLSKSFSLAGARIAYIAGNRDMIDMIARFKSNLDYGIFAPIQTAAVAALDHAEEIGQFVRSTFQRRRDVFTEELKRSGWVVDRPSGGMFIWAEVPSKWPSSKEFAFHCIDEAGVVMVPGSAFGSAGEGYVRIALVQPEDQLMLAAQKLQTIFSPVL